MNEIKDSTIGERIKLLRKKRGYNQKELANLLGKSLRTIQKYESGEIEVSIAMINELARVLDTTSTYLLGHQTGDFKFDCLSDVMECLFQLEKISGLHFSIETKRPPHHDGWKCSITFDGKDITHVPAHAMTKEGIGISPEGREVFPELTVEENLRIGAFVVKDENKIKESYERVYELFPRLKERITQQAGTLSGGEQQMLAVGRALMSNPKMILLDEPSLGLAPNFVEMIFGMIEKINKQGVTVLLIEQNANMALQVSQRAYVLENGLVSMSGKASDIANNPMVKKAYLGMA